MGPAVILIFTIQMFSATNVKQLSSNYYRKCLKITLEREMTTDVC